MKKILLALAVMMAAGTATGYAQNPTKDLLKERQAMAGQSQSELTAKASKAARKEARRLRKEGWTVAPGALPLEKQLDRSYTMQYDIGADLFPKYIIAEASSVGANYDAAKMQALELAKQNLAGQIQTELTALIESTVANEQLSADDAASVTRTISASKALISQGIGRTQTITEVYRDLPNKAKEVLVRIAYDEASAKATVRRAVRDDLSNLGDALQRKLDLLFSR